MPKTIIITGSAGLIGAEACRYFTAAGYVVVGIDNDLRASFFGKEASTAWAAERLKEELGSYSHRSIDIRDKEGIVLIFEERNEDIFAVFLTAAQPSHDRAVIEPVSVAACSANEPFS